MARQLQNVYVKGVKITLFGGDTLGSQVFQGLLKLTFIERTDQLCQN